MVQAPADPSSDRLLDALADLPAGTRTSLARLAKQFDSRVSVLLRLCNRLGSNQVDLRCDDAGHWSVARVAPHSRRLMVRRWRSDDGQGAPEWSSPEGALDDVAVETPVALVFNGVSHAVMMATPCELEAFALGFALSEGLIEHAHECHDIEVQAHGSCGATVQLRVSARAEAHIKARRRTLAGRTGCGLCGIDSLAQFDADIALPSSVTPCAWAQALPPETLLRAFEALPARQQLNALTGCAHAAAWVSPDGGLLHVMEDVGRHNALDKLLGWRARAAATIPGFVIMSSRASHELVQKCARLNVPILATISAPTTLAIERAQHAGLILFGFCRRDSLVHYAHG